MWTIILMSLEAFKTNFEEIGSVNNTTWWSGLTPFSRHKCEWELGRRVALTQNSKFSFLTTNAAEYYVKTFQLKLSMHLYFPYSYHIPHFLHSITRKLSREGDKFWDCYIACACHRLTTECRCNYHLPTLILKY
jgi:hypothetical protein